MIKLENTEVMGFEGAVRGMRNPMNSWDKSDSGGCCCADYNNCHQKKLEKCTFFTLGPSDLSLAKKLIKAGTDHRKFMRQIFVSVDITAPLYWWNQYDTYKVGTTANSTSKMHKIHSKPITIEDFSCDGKDDDSNCTFGAIVEFIEELRQSYNHTKNSSYWRGIIQLLPSSYNQTRTCTMTYENLLNMYYARRNHKLSEWHVFCEWIESLPYMKDFLSKE